MIIYQLNKYSTLIVEHFDKVINECLIQVPPLIGSIRDNSNIWKVSLIAAEINYKIPKHLLYQLKQYYS